MRGKFYSALSFVFLLVSPFEVDAFYPVPFGVVTKPFPTLYAITQQPEQLSCCSSDTTSSFRRREFLTSFVAGSGLVGCLLNANVQSALAAHIMREGALSFGSTSVYVAEDIKIVDTSLPSYDSISPLKLSTEGGKGLGVENLLEGATKSSPVARKKVASGGGFARDGEGNPWGNLLPSMNKKPRSPEATSSTPKKRSTSVLEEKQEDAIKTMDLSLPSYSEGTRAKEKNAFAL